MITTDDILYGFRTEGITITVETSHETIEDIISKFPVKATGRCSDTTSYCEFDTNTPLNAEMVRLVVENKWNVSLGWSLIEDDENDRGVLVEFKDGVITNYEEEVYENG